MNTEVFDSLYKNLNAEQKKVVDTIEGPVMVVAGPGTGKTQILTLRIANILKETDTPADAILALTFTNAGAIAMRSRLVSIIGSDAYRVGIFTFHSFAESLITTYDESFPSMLGRSSCSDVEQLDIIRTLLEEGRYEKIKPLNDPFYYAKQIVSSIGDLKKEGFTQEEFEKWIEEEKRKINEAEDLVNEKGVYKGKIKTKYALRLKKLEKDAELARIYGAYEKALKKRKRYDFDDMLLELLRAFKTDESFLRFVQEQYHYFLVDEHQDTNGAQNSILDMLATFFDAPNLFVVGDEKQAIFRFQGASMENFLYFEKKFRTALRITLTKNYRSTQTILDNADTLIGHSAHTLRAPLSAESKEKNIPLSVCQFNSPDEELLFIAESIQKKIKEGIPLGDIAVLYRNNNDVKNIGDYFERLGIPFIVASGHGVLDDPDVQKLHSILCALEDLDNSDTLAPLLFFDIFHINIEDVYALLRRTRKEKCTLFEILSKMNTEKSLSLPLSSFYAFLISAKRSAENESFLTLFEMVVRETKLLEHIQKSSFHIEKFDKIVRLFDEVKSFVRRDPFFTLSSYKDALRVIQEHHLEIQAKSRSIPEAVRLMTAHKAKGLEFSFVYIVHTQNKKWGGNKNKKYFLLPIRVGDTLYEAESGGDTQEDERRLFYVALTRAKKQVFFTYSLYGHDGKEHIPSQFLKELQEENITFHTAESLGYSGKRPPFFIERKGLSGKEKYVHFMREAFLEKGLSSTALNNFLTCPWRWFYNNFFYTQFTYSLAQKKGTSAHNALEDFFNRRNTEGEKGEEEEKKYIMDRFSYYFEDNDDISPFDKERVHTEMRDALSGWYSKRVSTFPKESINELFIGGVILDDGIKLTGKIDRLECKEKNSSPSSCHSVRVIDYKTGKQKSDAEASGTRKSDENIKGSGGYKRQIIFYALLLDKFKEGKYRAEEGVVDYLIPNERGNYGENIFSISEEEKDALVNVIKKTAEDIKTFSFWNERCSQKECPYCKLREMMDE
jgi:DNA helicase II / ATP-dependent DNA helicase PcrA